MIQDEKSRRAHGCVCITCYRHPYSRVANQHRAINRVLETLDERNRRRFVGLLALQWGRGGITRLQQITGMSRMTIRRGRTEIQHAGRRSAGRIRQTGGGRPLVEKKDPAF